MLPAHCINCQNLYLRLKVELVMSSSNEAVGQVSEQDLELGESIGNGTWGNVKSGTWKRASGAIPVAVKILSMHGITARQSKQMIAEINTLSQVEHSNILRIFGACFVGHPAEMWIVAELVQGGESLYSVLHTNNNDISWNTRLKLALEASIGVKELHRRDILHKDVKSLNFVVSQDLQSIKLIDFGPAKFYRTTVPAGTYLPVWGAPETLEYPPQWSIAADVYSLGCTFYELAARRVPFSEVEDSQLRAAVESVKRPEIPDDCPEEFANLIHWCWERQPQNRPSVQMLIERLQIPIKSHGCNLN